MFFSIKSEQCRHSNITDVSCSIHNQNACPPYRILHSFSLSGSIRKRYEWLVSKMFEEEFYAFEYNSSVNDIFFLKTHLLLCFLTLCFQISHRSVALTLTEVGLVINDRALNVCC